MQPVDLITFAGQLGFSDEQMIVFEDTSVPGDSSTDERDGLSRLMDAITQGTIQTVLVANERRLFRHRDAVDVNAFLRLCAEYDVAVITPQIIYDFSNPFMMQLFRFQCQEAATMLAQRVRFRLSTGMKTENHNR